MYLFWCVCSFFPIFSLQLFSKMNLHFYPHNSSPLLFPPWQAQQPDEVFSPSSERLWTSPVSQSSPLDFSSGATPLQSDRARSNSGYWQCRWGCSLSATTYAVKVDEPICLISEGPLTCRRPSDPLVQHWRMMMKHQVLYHWRLHLRASGCLNRCFHLFGSPLADCEKMGSCNRYKVQQQNLDESFFYLSCGQSSCEPPLVI